MMSKEVPPIIYVDTSESSNEDFEVDDDDMLDPTDLFFPSKMSHPPMMRTVSNNSRRKAPLRRQAPSHTLSLDSFAERPTLRREAQASYCPSATNICSLEQSQQGQNHRADYSTSHCSGISSSFDSTSIPSTHLAIQYMQGMRRLSRSIRQTEMTRTVLRKSALLRNKSASHAPDLRGITSSYSCPSVEADRNQVFCMAQLASLVVTDPQPHQRDVHLAAPEMAA